MSHTASEGVEMVATVKGTNRIVEIGSQRVSSVVCKKAKQMLADGAIGEVNLIEGSLGRNDPTGAWVYPPPPDLSTTTLDWDTWQGTVPKRSFDPKIFARWRCWREYGTGVAGDLLVHLVSGMNFMMGWNEAPTRAMSMGGILRFPDGRNMPDVQATIFEYGKIPVYLRLNLGCETPETYRFQGSKGILEVTSTAIALYPQSGEDSGPSYYASSFPHDLREAYYKQWHEEHDPAPGQEPLTENYTYHGDDWDDERPHMWAYFQAVRSRKPVPEDTVFGHHAALACHMANESYFRKAPVTWDATANQIKT
jgi:predicted dehydrogenase